jgi:predicted phosphodiesterase
VSITSGSNANVDVCMHGHIHVRLIEKYVLMLH